MNSFDLKFSLPNLGPLNPSPSPSLQLRDLLSTNRGFRQIEPIHSDLIPRGFVSNFSMISTSPSTSSSSLFGRVSFPPSYPSLFTNTSVLHRIKPPHFSKPECRDILTEELTTATLISYSPPRSLFTHQERDLFSGLSTMPSVQSLEHLEPSLASREIVPFQLQNPRSDFLFKMTPLSSIESSTLRVDNYSISLFRTSRDEHHSRAILETTFQVLQPKNEYHDYITETDRKIMRLTTGSPQRAVQFTLEDIFSSSAHRRLAEFSDIGTLFPPFLKEAVQVTGFMDPQFSLSFQKDLCENLFHRSMGESISYQRMIHSSFHPIMPPSTFLLDSPENQLAIEDLIKKSFSESDYLRGFMPENSFEKAITLPVWKNKTSRTFETGGLWQPHVRIVGINGMNTHLGTADSHAQYVKSFTPDRDIEWIHNQTHGVIGDLLEIWYLNYEGISLNTGPLLKEKWLNFHKQNIDRPNAKILQLGHSQGAIHIKNNLEESDPEVRNRVIVLAIAPAAVISNEICYKAFNYASKKDFIPRLELHFYRSKHPGRLGEAKERHKELIWLDPHSGATGIDHDFQSPTFKYHIERHIKDYLDRNGVYE